MKTFASLMTFYLIFLVDIMSMLMDFVLEIHIINEMHQQENSPQIFKGASNSNKIGWLRKISLDFKQRPLISFSVSCTFLPGRDPRTAKSNEDIHD